ncbi:secreted protein C-like [Hyalella azteca]|uniref:Secreted protein C-like n=1 Tax=Hyalella azteca TaxID=294128 RepID=A0A979FPP3_HYAAZ|nr:secreted protein C-like [Hyalella azteca]
MVSFTFSAFVLALAWPVIVVGENVESSAYDTRQKKFSGAEYGTNADVRFQAHPNNSNYYSNNAWDGHTINATRGTDPSDPNIEYGSRRGSFTSDPTRLASGWPEYYQSRGSTSSYPAGSFSWSSQNYSSGSTTGSTQSYPSGLFSWSSQNYPSGSTTGSTQSYPSGLFSWSSQDYSSGSTTGLTQSYPSGLLSWSSQNYPSGSTTRSTQSYPSGSFSTSSLNYSSEPQREISQRYPAGSFSGSYSNYSSGSVSGSSQSYPAGLFSDSPWKYSSESASPNSSFESDRGSSQNYPSISDRGSANNFPSQSDRGASQNYPSKSYRGSANYFPSQSDQNYASGSDWRTTQNNHSNSVQNYQSVSDRGTPNIYPSGSAGNYNTPGIVQSDSASFSTSIGNNFTTYSDATKKFEYEWKFPNPQFTQNSGIASSAPNFTSQNYGQSYSSPNNLTQYSGSSTNFSKDLLYMNSNFGLEAQKAPTEEDLGSFLFLEHEKKTNSTKKVQFLLKQRLANDLNDYHHSVSKNPYRRDRPSSIKISPFEEKRLSGQTKPYESFQSRYYVEDIIPFTIFKKESNVG